MAQRAAFAVSVAYEVFYGVRLLALRPTPKPGGPGDRSLSGLYPLTCPAWVVTLPGVQDSRRYSSRGRGDTQAASPLQGDDPTEAASYTLRSLKSYTAKLRNAADWQTEGIR